MSAWITRTPRSRSGAKMKRSICGCATVRNSPVDEPTFRQGVIASAGSFASAAPIARASETRIEFLPSEPGVGSDAPDYAARTKTTGSAQVALYHIGNRPAERPAADAERAVHGDRECEAPRHHGDRRRGRRADRAVAR